MHISVLKPSSGTVLHLCLDVFRDGTRWDLTGKLQTIRTKGRAVCFTTAEISGNDQQDKRMAFANGIPNVWTKPNQAKRYEGNESEGFSTATREEQSRSLLA
ncbi:hypothetical protein HZ326_16942 [Fusarium oxysporum f. sp. albedinis]|nr:hypothetical protein HZ326_16942 [Fusarium oxysporum f. sp. albedinis]